MASSSSSSVPPYELSTELVGHEGSVRAVLSIQEGTQLISGGDDGTVKRWLRVEAPAQPPTDPPTIRVTYECLDTIAEAEHWVITLLALPPGVLEEAPQGGFIAGSQDKMIRVYDLEGNQLRIFIGHQHGVISLSWSASGHLISGSWDGTAKIWDVAKGEVIQTLDDHENGVSVLGLPNGDIVTGSTGREQGGQIVDVQIRLWRDGRVIKTMKDHAGPVRSLALLPQLGFLSTSNDGTVRAWSMECEPLAVVSAPPGPDGSHPFIYRSVAIEDRTTGSTDVVAVGEDGAANVWRGQDLIQSIHHPRGLWAVGSIPEKEGEVVTGCHDGVIRMYTRDSRKQAPLEVRQAFQRTVEEALSKLARGGPSPEEIAKLPDWNDRYTQVGKREGMVQMFRKNGVAIAAQWSSDSSAWIEVGEVTGASHAGTVNGVTYDHVFPIEIEQPGGEGVRNLQIGYNNGENPFVTAQTFIDQHQLPQRYLAQIADYITQRAKQAAPMIGMGGAAAGGGGGASSYQGAAAVAAPPPPPTTRHFPKVGYLSFDAGQLDKISAKIMEFAEELSPFGVSLSEGDKVALTSLVATLSATSRYHATEVKAAEIRALNHILTTWPAEKVFPGIDLLRMTVLHPTIKGGLPTPVIERVISLGESNPGSAPIVMLSLRCLTNFFRHSGPREVVGETPVLFGRSLQLASHHTSSTNKSIRSAVAALLLNQAVYLSEPEGASLASTPITSQLIQTGLFPVLSGEGGKEEDVALKIVVALGTLVSKSSTKDAAKSAISLSGVTPARLLGLEAGSCLKEAVEDLIPLL